LRTTSLESLIGNVLRARAETSPRLTTIEVRLWHTTDSPSASDLVRKAQRSGHVSLKLTKLGLRVDIWLVREQLIARHGPLSLLFAGWLSECKFEHEITGAGRQYAEPPFYLIEPPSASGGLISLMWIGAA
jgi:hypothetical protein